MRPLKLSELEAQVRTALAKSLPGVQAHTALAPRPRRGWRAGYTPEDSRRAAGLLLLYPKAWQPHVALTVRAEALPQHGGQVSLPGGTVERAESVEQAALREASEEIGLDPTQVRILGALTPLHIPVSAFVLHPVVAVADTRPSFRAADREVARILEAAIEELADESRLRREKLWRDGREYEIPYFDLCGEHIWGATAMVLAELLYVIGRPPRDPWAD